MRPPELARPGDTDGDGDDVASRFRWARAAGHPRYVWPEVPFPRWRRALEAIAETTAVALGRGEDASPARLVRPEGVDDMAMGVAAFTSGMGPLLGHWSEVGVLATDEPLERLFAEHLRHGRMRVVRAREILQDIAERFASVDVPFTLLKGSHTGPRYFPEPGARPSQDIDLVVAPRDMTRAESVLAAGGYRKTGSQPGPKRSDWTPPGGARRPVSLLLTHADNPLDVDLHGAFRRKLFGVRTIDLTPGPGDLVPRADLPGAVYAVDGALLALTVATHASEDLEALQLVRLVELVFIQRGWSGSDVFGADALARARALSALRFAYPAVALAEQLAPGTVDPRYLTEARLDAPPTMLRILDRLDPASAQRLAHHTFAERFMAVRGPVEFVKRLAHLAVPTSTGWSPRRLARMYRDRWFRFTRGKMRVRESYSER